MKRKIITLLLMLALLISSITPTQKAEAAAKLSKTSITLTIGKTTTIKLSGGNATWTVKNAKIKILKQTKKSAKIQAMSKGTTYLYAKVGNKKLKCKVTCKANSNSNNKSEGNFSTSEAKSKITFEKFKANGYVYVKAHSEYEVPTEISATCNFCNSNGQVIDYKDDSIEYLEKGHTAYLIFDDSSHSYDSIEVKYKYEKGLDLFYHSSIISDLTLTHLFVDDEYSPYIMLTVTNGGNKECFQVDVFIEYYDKADNLVAVSCESLGRIASGSSGNKMAYSPYDNNTFDDIPYDHYKAFIGWAYHLGK